MLLFVKKGYQTIDIYLYLIYIVAKWVAETQPLHINRRIFITCYLKQIWIPRDIRTGYWFLSSAHGVSMSKVPHWRFIIYLENKIWIIESWALLRHYLSNILSNSTTYIKETKVETQNNLSYLFLEINISFVNPVLRNVFVFLCVYVWERECVFVCVGGGGAYRRGSYGRYSLIP